MPSPTFEKADLLWTLPWQDDWVTAVAFVGSARRLAAGNQRGGLLVWDLPEKPGGPTPAPVRRLDGHTNAIARLIPAADGRRLISASYDHSIRIWDLDAAPAQRAEVVVDARTREAAAKKAGKNAPPPAPGASVGTQTAERVLEGHRDWIQSMVLSRDGKVLASGDDSGLVIVWDPATGKEVRRRQVKGWVYGMALSPDAQQLLVAERIPLIFDSGRHGAVKIWSVGEDKMIRDLTPLYPKEHFSAAAFSPDGLQLALGKGGEGDGKIFLVDPAAGKKVREMPGHQYGICDLAYSADGRFLLSAGRDTTVKVWQCSDGKMVKELGKPRGGQFKDQMHALALSPDESRLAAGDMAGMVHLWATG
jgi:WD40 repeat protein